MECSETCLFWPTFSHSAAVRRRLSHISFSEQTRPTGIIFQLFMSQNNLLFCIISFFRERIENVWIFFVHLFCMKINRNGHRLSISHEFICTMYNVSSKNQIHHCVDSVNFEASIWKFSWILVLFGQSTVCKLLPEKKLLWIVDLRKIMIEQEKHCQSHS